MKTGPMKRKLIHIPEELVEPAEARARARGMSFSEVVREALRQLLFGRAPRKLPGRRDPAFAPIPFPAGITGPRDASVNHDEYIYEEPPPDAEVAS